MSISYAVDMTQRVDDLITEALTLPVDERLHLARELLASLDPGQPDGDEQAVARSWASEIDDRVRAAKSGEVTPLDGPATLDELFA